VDTEVSEFYSDNELISAPSPGDPFFGQDATYLGNSPSYTDPGDGTIIDQVTGLFWEKNMGQKISYSEALIKADTLTAGGYDDWRVPTIKELYSLIPGTLISHWGILIWASGRLMPRPPEALPLILSLRPQKYSIPTAIRGNTPISGQGPPIRMGPIHIALLSI
jgi:hypothetical protein